MTGLMTWAQSFLSVVRRNSAENPTGISAGDAKRARQIARLGQQRNSRWATRWPASTRTDRSSAEASSLHDLRYEELFHERVCVAVAPQHPFARRRAIPLTEVATEPLIGLTREDYPEYYDHLPIIFSKVKQKPRVVEGFESMSGVMSAVEAGTGVAIGTDLFGYSFGNRVKLLHLIPEPKPISVGIVGTKGRLSPATEKFWQCAKEAAAAMGMPKR